MSSEMRNHHWFSNPSKHLLPRHAALARCRPPPNCILLTCFICAVGLLSLLTTPSPPDPTAAAAVAAALPYYRRLREQAAADLQDIRAITLASNELPLCAGRERENAVPCYNVSANLLAGLTDGDEFDRHCELDTATDNSAGVDGSLSLRCLVRPPKEYRIPLRWPAGRDVVWSANVKITKDQFFSSGSMTKRIMLLEENQIAFHSEDGANFDGVKDYSSQIAEMIGLASDSDFLQAGVRTVLDIGCGFGSFGAHLFSVKLVTVCIAAYEASGSQVQLALERGLPAIIGNFVSRQLPYPSLSFDMVHCAQCGIDWDKKGGAFLIEVDRLLRPGGYFVLTSPSTKHQGGSLSEKNRILYATTEEFAHKVCWSLLGQQDETFIWQKSMDPDCYASRKDEAIPVCKEETDSGSYYNPLLSCISGTSSHRWVPIQNTTHWLPDYKPSSEELRIHGVDPDEFNEDSRSWSSALTNYWSLLSPLIFSDHPKRPGDEDPLPPYNMIRNVMDMSAHFGGLNAALLEEQKLAWVMNVVPTGFPNTLPLIVDRGFPGVLHNWCEPFPTYPRTYDLLHAMGLLSHLLASKNCDIFNLFLEMDRILRPEGWVILHDTVQAIEKSRTLVSQVRWEARVIDLQSSNEQRLLVCQKPFLRK